MDTSTLESCFGTYRIRQDPTPRQRRVLRWTAVTVLVAFGAWSVLQLLHEGLGGVLPILIYMALAMAAGAISGTVGRRLGPLTRIGPDGVMIGTGLTGGRRSVGWDEIHGLDGPQRFEMHPAAVLRSGARVELPGLPAAVTERLSAELTRLRAGGAPSAPRPVAPRVNGEEGWEGPFRRG